MIYGIYELPRSPDAATNTFGYQVPLWYPGIDDDLGYRFSQWEKYLLAGTPQLQSINDAPRNIPIIKILEFYPSQSAFACPSQTQFVERLCIYDNTGMLIPYVVRYRNPLTGYPAGSVIYRENLQAYHRDASQIPSFHLEDPCMAYIDNTVETEDLVGIYPWIQDMLYKRDHLLKWFSADAQTTKSSRDRISCIKRIANQTHVRTSIATLMDTSSLLLSAITPPIYDPLTKLFPKGEVSYKEFTSRWAPYKPISDWIPEPIDIPNPAMTAMSPAAHQTVAGLLSQISASDLEMEYILSNGTIISRDIKFYYDRYYPIQNATNNIADLETCDRIVRHVGVSDPRLIFPGDLVDQDQWRYALASDVKVILKRTFNEEALIEVQALDDPNVYYAVHFDLALLSLCSLGTILTGY